MMKWMYKGIFLSLGCMIAPLMAQETSAIIAVVNDHPIAQRDLEHRLNMAFLSSGVEKTADTINQLKPQILQLMIDEILQQELGDKYKITVTSADIDRMVQSIEVQNNMQPGAMKALFEKNNIPFDIMRNHLKARQTWQDYIKAKYTDAVTISPQEVARYMDNMKKTRNQPHYLVSEIFIPYGDDVPEAQALKHISVLADKIKRGAPFGALAQEFSRLPSAGRGGDRGWITLDTLDAPLRPMVAALSPGQVSQPIRVEGGFYLIAVRQFQKDGNNVGKDTFLTFLQALFPVTSLKDQQALEQVYLKAKSYGHQAKSCSAATSLLKNNKGVNLHTVSRASVSQLPAELRKLLLALNSKPSDPILTDGGFIIFWLCHKEDYNPQEPTEDDIQNLLLDQKLSLLSQRELRHLHRGAVITLRQ